MNLSRKWLNEFVTVDANDKEFAEAMTLSGSKVEVTEDLGAEIQNVVVGRIVALERHPDSDHMWVCQIDVAEEEPIQIVCGAPNVNMWLDKLGQKSSGKEQTLEIIMAVKAKSFEKGGLLTLGEFADIAHKIIG